MYAFVVLFPLSGVTVAGYANGTAATDLTGLNNPWGLAIDVNNSLYVSDSNNNRVMKFQAGFLNGSIVAGTQVGGSNANQLSSPAELRIDTYSNIYVDDNSNCRVMLWRKNSSSGVIVAGSGVCGSSTSTIGTSIGLALDSQGNIYVSDKNYNRVMKWAPNATFGILVAGTPGVAGSSNQQLNTPFGLYLDENNSYIYIADLGNHRIQRYTLGITANGTTVAGGNGQGSSSSQLSEPHGVYVSKKTGDIYIADMRNNRIQRWSPGASSGVTIVGITGVTSTNATMLNSPIDVILSMDETFLYVSDNTNNRVQRYQLP